MGSKELHASCSFLAGFTCDWMREGLVLTAIAADRQGNGRDVLWGNLVLQKGSNDSNIHKKASFQDLHYPKCFYYFSSLKVVHECMARNSVTVKYSVTYLCQGVLTQIFFEFVRTVAPNTCISNKRTDSNISSRCNGDSVRNTCGWFCRLECRPWNHLSFRWEGAGNRKANPRSVQYSGICLFEEPRNHTSKG